ncbi:MAG: signal peptidase I [Planctomycetota bacterium]
MRRIWWRTALKVSRLFFVAFILALFCQQQLITSYRIAGNSMAPSYWDGDRVVVAHTLPLLSEPENGDAVIVRVDGETLIKRVAAGPGQIVEIRSGHLVRNGEAVSEPIPSAYLHAGDMPPCPLGGDEFFLLGDHRRVSVDSRDFGPVRRDQIIGRVLFRVESGSARTAAASSLAP